MQAGSFVVAKRYLCKLPRNGLESAKPTFGQVARSPFVIAKVTASE